MVDNVAVPLGVNVETKIGMHLGISAWSGAKSHCVVYLIGLASDRPKLWGILGHRTPALPLAMLNPRQVVSSHQVWLGATSHGCLEIQLPAVGDVGALCQG
jgi:hypothetical protein